MDTKKTKNEKLTIAIVEKRVREHPKAREAMNTLVDSGCDRSTLLFLLSGDTPTLRAWKRFQETIVAHPKRLLALSNNAAEMASAIEAAVVKTVTPSIFDPSEKLRKAV